MNASAFPQTVSNWKTATPVGPCLLHRHRGDFRSNRVKVVSCDDSCSVIITFTTSERFVRKIGQSDKRQLSKPELCCPKFIVVTQYFTLSHQIDKVDRSLREQPFFVLLFLTRILRRHSSAFGPFPCILHMCITSF